MKAKYNGKRFENIIPTSLGIKDRAAFRKALKESFFGDRKSRTPQVPMKTVSFDKNKFSKLKNAFAWLGHSTILMKVDNLTIVSDPVFGRASPFSFAGPKPFKMSNPPRIKDLPDKIDILLLTHDHYDHLEKETIKKIHKKAKKIFVPLKVKKILVDWSVPKNKIKEFDWYEETKVNNTKIIFTPSRHFAGRNITNRNSTLWGGWIIKSKTNNIFISGDSGYLEEFKKIGKKYGPFDIAFMENGQYNEAWIDVHMLPEQSVQAGIDSKSKILFPTHWGKYNLSIHPWNEPVKRFTKEAKQRKQKVTTPLIGEIFNLNKLPTSSWWKK